MEETKMKLPTGSLVALSTTMMFAMISMSAAQTETLRDDNPNNWPLYNRTFDGTRYSPLKEISKENIKNLHVAWVHQPGAITQGLLETPLVIDGVVYSIASQDRVFALNAATGEEIWHYFPRLDDVANEIFFTPYSRGVAVAHGRVYIGTVDGRAIALDQKTGKELWQTKLTEPRKCAGCNFTSPPAVAGDILTYGPTGGDLADQGKIFGVEAETGKLIWTFETLRDDPKSWGGDSRRSGGGGAWMPGAYDPKTDTVLYGTGNPAPDYDWGGARPGDNLYTSGVVALDPKTGKLKWHFQEVPHDPWDFDGAAGEFLFVQHDGKRSIVHSNKGGYVYVYDAESGALQNAWPLAENITWIDGVDPKTGAFKNLKLPKFGEKSYACPWLVGAKSWNSGSYSPDTGLWYQNVMEACNVVQIEKGPPESVPLSALYYGGTATAADPPNGKAHGHLDARDPLTGERKWKIDTGMPMMGSLLTTASGLLFAGDLRGYAHAYDAKTGEELWKFNLGSGTRGGPVTYAVDGKQYIIFPSGLGSQALGFVSQIWPELNDYPAGAALVAFTVN
jgi:alcohol dehydrogenase (cytochrome c)